MVLVLASVSKTLVILCQLLEIQEMLITFKTVIDEGSNVPIVKVDGVGFRVGTWGNNQSVILFLFDGATLAVQLLQDFVCLFAFHI